MGERKPQLSPSVAVLSGGTPDHWNMDDAERVFRFEGEEIVAGISRYRDCFQGCGNVLLGVAQTRPYRPVRNVV